MPIEIPEPPVAPEHDIWTLAKIARRWGMNADMADAELKASGFHSAEIPRKPAIGYKFSDVLAFEARWRELKSKREKEHAEDLKRWAEADARLQRKQAEADKLVADTLTKDRSRVR